LIKTLQQKLEEKEKVIKQMTAKFKKMCMIDKLYYLKTKEAQQVMEQYKEMYNELTAKKEEWDPLGEEDWSDSLAYGHIPGGHCHAIRLPVMAAFERSQLVARSGGAAVRGDQRAYR
jgi:hypothetical protein